MADIYFSYGKALLENAITQNSVLGKEQAEEGITGKDEGTLVAPSPPLTTGTHIGIPYLFSAEAGSSGAFLSFSGDAEDHEEATLDSEDPAVDLFAEAEKAVTEGDGEREEEEEEGEPEDDFNAAWEVLDLARAIYEKQEGDDEVRLKLADIYISLGDVSLETGTPLRILRFLDAGNSPFLFASSEKFEQAISDYEAGLELKVELLPQSSRQIAEAHYKLAIVLDLSSGQLSESIAHAEKALESVEARLAELRNGISGQMRVETLPDKSDPKGKGKAPARGPRLLGKDAIQMLTKSQMEAEVKELEGLKEDLAAKAG